MPDAKLTKSRNHKIVFNNLPKPNAPSHPYKLLWSVSRRGSNQGGGMGFPVEMNRTTDREGAEEFAARWGVKMPTGGPK